MDVLPVSRHPICVLLTCAGLKVSQKYMATSDYP